MKVENFSCEFCTKKNIFLINLNFNSFKNFFIFYAKTKRKVKTEYIFINFREIDVNNPHGFRYVDLSFKVLYNF